MSNKPGISESLTTLRDEARVQLHLVSMDARAYWRELEDKLAALEHKLDENGGKLSEALAATEQELATKVKEYLKTHGNAAKSLL